MFYTVGHDAAHQASYESKKRGYDALNEFFGDLKRRQLDPTSYTAVGQRLLNLQALPLPLTHGGAVTDYQPMPAMVGVGGHGGYASGPMPTQSYHLPPMGNLRTKADLMNIDQFLEQMQSTVYESDENAAAAGIAQPGAHYLQGGLSYRTANSPPTANHIPSSHATATTSAAPFSFSNPTRSPHSSTPALTPPSSAQSYTSGRSPMSLSSHHNIPPSQHPHAQSSSGMYPTLPATTAQENAAAGYPSVSNAAPPSTLSSMFDGDDRRRFTGGMLQRSRPQHASQAANADAMSISSFGHSEEKAGDARRSSFQSETPKLSHSVIDPALRRDSFDFPDENADEHASNSPPSKYGSSSPTPGAPDASDILTGEARSWAESVRLLQKLRDYITRRLEGGDYEDGEEERGPQDNEYMHYPNMRMDGMEAIAAAAVAHQPHEQPRREAEPRRSSDNLYPVIRMDMKDNDNDHDNDEHMKD